MVHLVKEGEQLSQEEKYCLELTAVRVRNNLLWPRHTSTEPLDDLVADDLLLPIGPCWREAACTAVLEWGVGDADEITIDGPVALDVQGGLSWLRGKTRSVHRQLTPLWQRKAGHRRVLLLDTPLGSNGLTLHDLVAGSPAPEEAALGTVPDDPRLAAVLNSLDPQERRVALAFAHWQPNSWAEAAALTGAADPVAYGERVRRKLKRLGAEHKRRRGGLHLPDDVGSQA